MRQLFQRQFPTLFFCDLRALHQHYGDYAQHFAHTDATGWVFSFLADGTWQQAPEPDAETMLATDIRMQCHFSVTFTSLSFGSLRALDLFSFRHNALYVDLESASHIIYSYSRRQESWQRISFDEQGAFYDACTDCNSCSSDEEDA